MNKINTYLNKIQKDIIKEEIIQEYDEIAFTLVSGTILIIIHLIILFMSAFSIINRIKVSKDLSKRLNKILKSGNKWIVHVYIDSSPNAFTFGFGRHIIVSTELLNMLTNREVDAVLLHESYHNMKKHTYKDLAMKYPFFYLCVYVLTVTGIASGTLITIPGLLAVFLIIKVSDIARNILMGRRMEYNADSFAVKYGYGKELISALKKINKWAEQMLKYQECGKMCQMMRKIDIAINEHPVLKDRIENVLKNEKKLKQVISTKSFGKIKSFLLKKFEK